MDVKHITNVATAKTLVATQKRAGRLQNTPVRKKPVAPPPDLGIDKVELKIALDKVIKNTRFQYEIKDKLGYFVVRIIDRDTDKVIREIPSKEIQTVREHIDRVIGLLYNKEI